jgi:fatty-acyl-CoA synthase
MNNAGWPFWPKGVSHELRVPQVTLNHYLDTAAQRYPDKPALIYAGLAIGYAQLHDRVLAVAAHLQQALGVRHGDRVLLISQNCPQFVIAYFAILRLGAAVVPINPMSTLPEVVHFVQDSGAEVAFVAQDLVPALLPLLRSPQAPSLRDIVAHRYDQDLSPEGILSLPPAMREPTPVPQRPGLHAFAQDQASPLRLEPIEVNPHDLAVLPYTSGTTGRPKGCCHTHHTVLASNIASQTWRSLSADAVTLCVAPLFHMLGMQSGMNVPMTLGSTVVMMPRWDAARAIDLIESHRVTSWAAPPAMVIDLFSQPGVEQRDLSSLSHLSGGGAAMPESVARMLEVRFGLTYTEAYGLTETAAFLHSNPPARPKRQCLGLATQGVDSRIVDPVSLQELPPGEVGELVTHGQQVMTGYWRNEAANREAFIDIGDKRFLRTGDLAMVDVEGYFFMRDRLKRMINASGLKVWPAEVEAYLYEHPAVHEACVIGVPDIKRGETVVALVVLKPGQRDQVSEAQLIEWSRQRMAVYKAPREVRWMDQLPKSSTGKILWRELQEREQALRTNP